MMRLILVLLTLLLFASPAQARLMPYAELVSHLTPIVLVDVSQQHTFYGDGAIILHPVGAIYQRIGGDWTLIYMPDGEQVRDLVSIPGYWQTTYLPDGAGLHLDPVSGDACFRRCNPGRDDGGAGAVSVSAAGRRCPRARGD